MSDLESYFQGRIRSANSAVHATKIIAELRQIELIASQALLLLGDGVPGGQGGRNRRVVISDERVCGVCHKRLGGSVVAALPDNSVVHYGCLNRSQRAFSSAGASVGAGEDAGMSESMRRKASTWSNTPPISTTTGPWKTGRSGGGWGSSSKGGFDG